MFLFFVVVIVEDKGDEVDGGWVGVIIVSGEISGLGIWGFVLLKLKFCFLFLVLLFGCGYVIFLYVGF